MGRSTGNWPANPLGRVYGFFEVPLRAGGLTIWSNRGIGPGRGGTPEWE